MEPIKIENHRTKELTGHDKAAPVIPGVMLTNKMNEVLENLRKTYNLKIDSPIYIEIEGKEIQFDCLIKGYGVAKGLIVDSKWKK